jgi:hypothetical protein
MFFISIVYYRTLISETANEVFSKRNRKTNSRILCINKRSSKSKLSIDELIYCKNLLNIKKRSYLKYDTFYRACQHNRLDIAKWVSFEFKFTKEDALGYDIDLLSKMKNDGELIPEEFTALMWRLSPLRTTYMGGHLHIVEWLEKTFELSEQEIIPHENILPTICRHYSIKIVDWIFSRMPGLIVSPGIRSRIIVGVATRSNIEFAEWITDKLNFTRDEWFAGNFTALYNACRVGELNFVKWLITKFKPPKNICINAGNDYIALKVACTSGHIEIVKYLLSLFEFTRAERLQLANILAQAANQGKNSDLYHWLYNCFGRRRNRCKKKLEKLKSEYQLDKTVEDE